MRHGALDPLPYIVALLAVAAALGVGLYVRPLFGIENVDLIFLTAIVGIAVRYGLWPSLAASAVASLAYNFFFLPPLYTFTIADPTNVAAFALFAALSFIVSNLAARGRMQTVTAHERVRTVEQLYAFSRKLAGAGTLDDVLWATAHQIATMLKVRVVLLLPEEGSIAVKAGYPPEDRLEEGDLAAAKWAWEKERPAGRDSDALPGAKWLFLPMRTGRGAVGILGISRDAPGPLVRAEQRRLLDALSDQGALAIERVHLVEDIERVRRVAETDRLRSALLTSISHDLKTPLAAVLGAAGALRDLAKSLDEDAKADLLATIIEESERLNRFIANLLDMTRLESGAVAPNAALQDVGEIVGSALERASKILARHRVEVEIAPDLPMVMVDAVLFEQVLFNLLDNAAKYARPADDGAHPVLARPGHACGCRCWTRARAFRRTTWSASSTSSTGCRRATRCAPAPGSASPSRAASSRPCGGTIAAANRTDRKGAVFTISLPVPKSAEQWKGCAMSAAPAKILVVDDEPPIRKLLRMGLASQGYEVLEAPNGKIALELLAEKPALVILDLGLPDVDGLELLRRIRQRAGGRAHRRAVEPRRRGRQGGGARSGRRRLRDQAVRDGGAARPHARGPAPPAAGARRAARVPGRRPERRSGAPHRQEGRDGGEALAQGVRPAAPARAARRQGADPQVPAAASCGTSRPIRNTCASTCGSCARRSRPTRSARSTS